MRASRASLVEEYKWKLVFRKMLVWLSGILRHVAHKVVIMFSNWTPFCFFCTTWVQNLRLKNYHENPSSWWFFFPGHQYRVDGSGTKGPQTSHFWVLDFCSTSMEQMSFISKRPAFSTCSWYLFQSRNGTKSQDCTSLLQLFYCSLDLVCSLCPRGFFPQKNTEKKCHVFQEMSANLKSHVTDIRVGG